MRKGIPIAPGVALGRVRCINPPLARECLRVDAASIGAEVERFERACAAAFQELAGAITQVRQHLGDKHAAIFRAHRLLLRDPAFAGKVKSTILEIQVDAATALQKILEEYAALLGNTEDEYLRERLADVRDVINRVRRHLAGLPRPRPAQANEDIILVTRELLPSHALLCAQLHPAGMVTEAGGATGHAAILIRSLGIPAVSGLAGIVDEVHTGDLLALDGREGLVYVNPSPEIQAVFRGLQRNYVSLRRRLVENRLPEPETADGTRVRLLANIGGPADAVAAAGVGAAGVGLYRTEYLFLSHPGVPSEEEQVAAYRKVIDAAPNRTVTIRTLDIGYDKQLPYLGERGEPNPALGWRSIRLLSACPQFFQTQLQAILRAGCFGKVSLLFPMISSLEEVRQLKELVAAARATLQKQGLPFQDLPLGIMLEVPAAALCLDDLLPEVDFISIGSNDLSQYLMAADRDNPHVAQMCEPFNPALYRLLAQVIGCCVARHKPVTLCGEMASRPRCFLPLLGMGLRSFSMSPAFVPSLKELVRRCSVSDALHVAETALHIKTANEMREYLAREVRSVWPEVSFMETAA